MLGGAMQNRRLGELPEPATIVAMGDADARSFVLSSIQSKSLSPLIGRLNEDLLDGDEASSDIARKALRRLGFL